MSTYKTKVGIDIDGNILIGHYWIKRADREKRLVMVQYRYPSQFPYMVVAVDDNGDLILTTRRESFKRDYEIVNAGESVYHSKEQSERA